MPIVDLYSYNKGSFSLLYPRGVEPDTFGLDEQTIRDLELDGLFELITPLPVIRAFRFDAVREVMLSPCRDEATIRYRQEVFEALLEYPDLLDAFEKLLPVIDALNYYRSARFAGKSALGKLTAHIGELESYIRCIETLATSLECVAAREGGRPRSEALAALHELVVRLHEDTAFVHLVEHLPEIASRIRNIRSITIGVNLNDSCAPVSATIVSINDRPFTDKSGTLFGRLFPHPEDGASGITPLRSISDQVGQFSSAITGQGSGTLRFAALFNDLSESLEKLCASVERSLGRYVRMNTSLFIDLRYDLVFYVFAVKFLRVMRKAGMPICTPTIEQAARRTMRVDDSFNVNLFVSMSNETGAAGTPKDRIVKNTIRLDDTGRIALVTGPNRGGKTVYTQSVGLIQIFFQAGLGVPGSSARISPVDGIFTHFQLEESIANADGRFADEVKRFAGCVGRATAESLLLLNESFASTSYVESLYVARDVLRALRLLGLRVVFSTHFHDLAQEIDAINAEPGGKAELVSLVSLVEQQFEAGSEVVRTFRIVPHAPMGRSYAAEIAYKFGISFDQMCASLRERGVL